ncbi:hypothetical protein F5Y11DRAFT_335777 [Daldinia sp. FL1419]|nr:hypothetical protein F5Y11DRAFT_335777 [Daldinia sp. FL1419]
MQDKMELGEKDHNGLTDEPFQNAQLLKALESISKRTCFASMTRINSFNPEIYVQDVGMINSPLQEAQAKQLVTKAHQIPCRRADQPTDDTPAPNIWELNPDQFKIRAPTWQTQLNKILVYIARKLDITSPISAELHNMLLYEQGVMTEAHADTGDTPGMFGKLVISLPSSHSGGDVVIKYREASKTLPTSQHDMACAFWFSDTSYEVLPIERGYHWVLVYNLTVDPTVEIPTAASRLENAALRTALESWSQAVSRGLRKPQPLCYAFDGQYTSEEEILSVKKLEDASVEQIRCLRNICADLDFDLFLGVLEKEEICTMQDAPWDAMEEDEEEDEDEEGDEKKEENHDDGDVCDVSYRLKKIFDLEENTLASDLLLDEESIFQEEPFTDIPYNEEYEGYMRDSEPRKTRWYSTTALVIVPCEGTVPLLTSNYSKGFFDYSYGVLGLNDFQRLCDFFINECLTSSKKALRLDQLYEFLTTNFDSRFAKSLTGNQLLKVLQLSIRGTEPGLLHLILTKNNEPPPMEFFAWLGEEYNKSTITREQFEKLSQYAFNLQPTIYKRWTALCDVNVDLEENEALRNLASRTVDECLEACRRVRLQEEDGKALFGLSFYHLGFEHLKTVVVPVLEDCGGLTTFIFGFLQSFDLKYSHVPKDDIRAVYERIALTVLDKVELDRLTAAEVPPDIGIKGTRCDSSPFYVNYKTLLKFISTLIELKLQKHLILFAKNVVAQADKLRGEELDKLWIPLLHGLFRVFEKRRVLLPTPWWRQIYQHFFKAYLLNYVFKEPDGPCRCSECSWKSEYSAERLAAYNVAMDNWWTRRLNAEAQLETFNQEMLRALLGDQYDDIVNMKLIRLEQPDMCKAKLVRQEQLELTQAASKAKITSSPSTVTPNPYPTPNLYPTQSPRQTPNPYLAPNSYTPPNRYTTPGLYIPPGPYTTPRPPVTYPTAVSGVQPRPRQQPTRKRSMLEISRRISESARKREVNNKFSPSTRRTPGTSSPASSSTPLRPTQTLPNPVAGTKYNLVDVEVIDLTGDD